MRHAVQVTAKQAIALIDGRGQRKVADIRFERLPAPARRGQDPAYFTEIKR